MFSRHKGLFLTLGAIALPTGIMLKSDMDFRLKFAGQPPAKSNEGKVVWIVGASSGIGASLAVDFAKDGANVIISARREPQLKEVAANCLAAGGKTATILPLDVTHFEDHQKSVDQVLKEFGKVDIIVLNAGISQRNFAAETPFEVTQQIINTNFLSYASLTRCILPSMIDKKQGKIVVMSSLAGLMGLPISTSYSASKFALHGYYDGIRAELVPHNIQVAIVCPGPVESEIGHKAHKNPKLPDHEDGVKMPTERCTSLIMKGLYHNHEEMWISDQPFLAMAYIARYCPPLAHYYVNSVLGPKRIHALNTGQSIYGDLKGDPKKK